MSPGPELPIDPELALDEAINGLAWRDPMASASRAFVPWQRNTLILSGLAAMAFIAAWPLPALTVIMAVLTTAYVVTISDRVLLFARGLRGEAIVRVTDEEALALTDEELPRYTILVPAYKEPEVVALLIGAVGGLDYPSAKLQVLLLLEADDHGTIDAAHRANLESTVTIIEVPPAEPRTKPKACNYGLHFATGEIVTIYDAEDHPEPLQLRRAVAAFRRLGDNVACIQAKLSFHNGKQNLLTGWFTAEYGLWFSFILPGLMSSRSPIPLGGTSNHLKRRVLEHIGAWDAFNVTEDADLGVRIETAGYHTAVLESTTMEEANSDPINWIRQRSRWYKGYLQTWLVHTRRPVALYRQLGLVSTFRMTVLLAGTPLIAILNTVFWMMTLTWFLGQPTALGELFPAPIYYPAIACLVLGNAATLFMGLISIRENGQQELLVPVLTVPLYWVMMSVAAIKGGWQLLRNPSFWEKTAHGLPGAGAST
ncbi:glycosyltransferase [Hoyosella sp. G463]|uniref:Glycosyltransferase n=1 Tax=Lolliginicoccus lacisalsi TaxID=2742202 RepID=A0A927PJQ7_9ACTN|nr:glycosyltransferase [Lolliginicoccus lacisalsi]MBD8505145.1 glycosyltransferase [Lolliginicoccus lacisalsi]